MVILRIFNSCSMLLAAFSEKCVSITVWMTELRPTIAQLPGPGYGLLMAAAGGRPSAASLRVAVPGVGGKLRPAAAPHCLARWQVARCGHRLPQPTQP